MVKTRIPFRQCLDTEYVSILNIPFSKVAAPWLFPKRLGRLRPVACEPSGVQFLEVGCLQDAHYCFLSIIAYSISLATATPWMFHSFVRVVIEPGVKIAAVARQAPAKRSVALYLLLSYR